MENSEASVSVIIPVFNGGEKFRKCLESIRECSPAPSEVVVVADGESDGSWRIAETFGFRTILLEKSHGPAFARNRGAEAASGDILYFVDADVTLAPNAISVVRSVFQNDSQISALIGSYDDAPFETNFLSQFKNLMHHYVHQQSREEASTFWGACGAVRKKAFDDIGGFDETYRNPSIEDIELGYRLVENGYRIRLVKHLFVKHLKRWTVSSLLRADILYRAVPWSELIIKKDRLINDLNLTVASRISVILVFMMLVLGALSVVVPVAGWPAAACAVIFLMMNRDVYTFFRRKRGIGFALCVVPWHGFYFFYSGLVFSFVLFRNKVTQAGHR